MPDGGMTGGKRGLSASDAGTSENLKRVSEAAQIFSINPQNLQDRGFHHHRLGQLKLN